MEQKVFFIIFKGLTLKQLKQIFLQGENPTLLCEYNFNCYPTWMTY